MPDPDPKYVEFAKAVETLLGGDSPPPETSPPETPAASAPPPAPTPPAGDPAPQGLPPAVATGAAEVAAQGGPGLPPGILSLEEVRRQGQAGRPANRRK